MLKFGEGGTLLLQWVGVRVLCALDEPLVDTSSALRKIATTESVNRQKR